MNQIFKYCFLTLFVPAFAFASIDQDCRVKIVKSNLGEGLHQSLKNKLVQNGFQFSTDATRGIEINANLFGNPTECQAGYEHRGCLIKVVGFEQASAGVLGNASVCVNSSEAAWQHDDIACNAAISKLALPSCSNNLKNSFEPDSSYSSNYTISAFSDSAETDVLDFAKFGQMEFESFKLSVSGIDPQTGSIRPYKVEKGINLLKQPIEIWNQKPLASLTDTVVLTVVKKTTNNSKDTRIKLSDVIDFKNIIPVNEIENGKASVDELNVKIAFVALNEDFDQLGVQVEIEGSGWIGLDKKHYSYDYIGILDISGPNAIWRKGEEDRSSTPRQSRYFPQKLKLGKGHYLGTIFTLVSTQHIRYNDKSPVISLELSKYDKASMRFVAYQSTAEFQVLLAPRGEGDSGQSEWNE